MSNILNNEKLSKFKITKNNAFYNINNNLIKVNIVGYNNKIVNPFRINDLYIHNDYNTIEVINEGKINILSYLNV